VTNPTPVDTRVAYGDAYFAVQIAKSDAKVRWEYSRLIALGGIALPTLARVLDAACGAAPGLRYFEGRVDQVVGLDVSASALRAAHDLLPDAQLIQADLDAPLPFADGMFDLIVLREAIEHVRDGEATLRHCLRTLRPGGCLAITTPNLWDARRPLFALTRRTWSGDADPTHTHLYTPREMGALLRRIGYGTVRIRTGFKPMARIGGKRLPVQTAIPYPPLIGNGIIAFGWREAVS
jgi:SAM-dependent methyltransferase